MFTTPHSGSEPLSDLSFYASGLPPLLDNLGVPLDPTQPVLPQAMQYVRKHWVDTGPAGPDASLFIPHTDAPDYPGLRQAGLIDPIEPRRETYDHVLVDGGTLRVYDYRLDYLEPKIAAGITGNVTLFSGQRLRFSNDDSEGKLEDIAEQALTDLDGWGRQWVETELAKSHDAESPWRRPFAAEHEIALLGLLRRYKSRLTHTATTYRLQSSSGLAGFPPAPIQAEHFALEDTQLTVLNGLAIVRSFAGRQLPAEVARPTARSCFLEWLRTTTPAPDASVLIVTHNPNIYRTWFDLTRARQAAGRADIVLDAAGAAIEPDRSHAYVLGALGRLIINLYNETYTSPEVI